MSARTSLFVATAALAAAPAFTRFVAPVEFDGFAMRAYWYAWSQFYPATEIAK